MGAVVADRGATDPAKLPTSDGLTGGYLADGVTPGPLLSQALGFVDTQIGGFVSELRAEHLRLSGNPKPYTASGLSTIDAGYAAANCVGVGPGDPRVPDLIGVVQHGVVYTGGKAKVAEHGGNDPQDRNVPLLVSGPGVAGRACA